MSMPAGSLELMTAEQLPGVDIPGKWTELVRGRLIVREPPSTYHGRVSLKLGAMMEQFAAAKHLGHVYAQDTGFKISSDPDTVRAPDVAFVAKPRLSLIPERGYAPIAPDLVVEVVSWNDRRGELLAKVGDWLDAGAQLVWVVDPLRQEAHVHRPDGSISILGIDDALGGEDVLPGFSCKLADVLPGEVDTSD